MARQRLVTRTIISTVASVKVINPDTEEIAGSLIILSGTYKDEKDVRKAVNIQLANDGLILLKLISYTEQETVYGMTEQDFIANAKPMKNHFEFED